MVSSCQFDTSAPSTMHNEPSLWQRMTRGISPVDIINVVRPAGRWRRHDNISYGTGRRQRLDIYQPETAGGPTIVFFYGGSWQSGTRDYYRFLGGSLAARGIMTVVPDYAVYPEARYPDFLQDAALAVRFVRDRAAEWGSRDRPPILMGHSAGAYIAAMLAFDRRWLDGVGLSASHDVAGFIGLAGPYDFLPIVDPILQEIFGGPDRIDTQPVRYVGGGEAPALLIAPRRDRVVSSANTTRMAARIREQGGRVRELHYPRVGHLSLIGAFAPGLRFLAPVLEDVTSFAADVTDGAVS